MLARFFIDRPIFAWVISIVIVGAGLVALQVLPIAQRFCRRPAQLPVLFGIALQRAIEHTADQLNPTLGATIAMESALAWCRSMRSGSVRRPRSSR